MRVAAIYARVSTERQARQPTIDSQLAVLRRWAEAEGHALAETHVFRDEGYSGSRLDRPSLDSLRDAVSDAAIEIVAVLSPDRLARRYAYQVLLLEEFRRAGVEVAFLHHPISEDPSDQLLLQIQGAIAEYERAVLAERFRRGKLQKARDGHLLSAKPPYGYRYVPRCEAVPGHLLIDDAEAAMVRRLFAWVADEQLSVRQSVRRLNEGPWITRAGRARWAPSTVHHILSDPVYIGTAYANRYEYVAPKKPRTRSPRCEEKTCRRRRPRDQWIAIPVPALVDQEAWDRAQAQMARNALVSFRNNKTHNYLLRCLLKCGICGLAIHGCGFTRTAGGVERRYHRCAGVDALTTGRDTKCPRAMIDAEVIEQAVWDHVVGLLSDPQQLVAQFERFVAETADGSAQDQAMARQLQARLDRLARADQRLLEAYQAEVISLEELAERRRTIIPSSIAPPSSSATSAAAWSNSAFVLMPCWRTWPRSANGSARGSRMPTSATAKLSCSSSSSASSSTKTRWKSAMSSRCAIPTPPMAQPAPPCRPIPDCVRMVCAQHRRTDRCRSSTPTLAWMSTRTASRWRSPRRGGTAKSATGGGSGTRLKPWQGWRASWSSAIGRSSSRTRPVRAATRSIAIS